MRYDIRFGTISWIDPNLLPPVGAALVLATIQDDWLVKTVMGLRATANYTPPPDSIDDVAGYQRTKAYRELTAGHVVFDVDAKTKTLGNVSEVPPPVLDPGWTPPFSRSTFPSSIPLSIFDAGIRDRTFYAGELSPSSKIVIGAAHPYGTLTPPQGDKIVAHTLIKFRAGKHTDDQGSSIGSPYHVPWVWCEQLLSYGPGRLRMQGVGSLFPTHSWYLAGSKRFIAPQIGDKDFIGEWTYNPKTDSNHFILQAEKMNLYPILTKGAQGAQTGLGGENNYAAGSPVTKQLNTVGGGKAQTYDLQLT